jgi:DUF1009 family protein
MKSLDTLNKNVILIAGSGSFVYEAAQYLTKKDILKKIYLLEENKLLLKSFSNMIIRSNIRNLELIIRDIKKLEIKNILIIGYVSLPNIKEIKLSLSTKLYITKDFFLNNISDQSVILKNLLTKKKLNLLSQKNIFCNFLARTEDENIQKDHSDLAKLIKKNTQYIKNIFKNNISQSFIMNGTRILAYEDIYGTDSLIKRIGSSNNNFNSLILIKSKKYNQIDEIDFPIVGTKTLKLLQKYNFKILCLFKDSTIISKKNLFLDTISKSNLSLIIL